MSVAGASGRECIRLGAFTLDPHRKRLVGDRGEAPLTPLSVRLLSHLAAAGGQLVTRAELIDALWSGNYLVGEQALNRVVSETRRAAKSVASATLIETVQKTGYRVSGLGPEPRRRTPFAQPTARLIFALAVFLVVMAAISVVIDSATGLVWIQSHAN